MDISTLTSVAIARPDFVTKLLAQRLLIREQLHMFNDLKKKWQAEQEGVK